MFTINFENLKKTGLSDGIYEEIKNKILTSSLKANEKLPSKRALSSHLGVSTITVQNAYERLICEGYVFSIEKKGYFVTDIEKELTLSKRAKFFYDKKNRGFEKDGDFEKVAGFEKDGTSEKKNEGQITLANKDSSVIDFYKNFCLAQKFPFRLWSSTIRKVLKTEAPLLLERPGAKGIESLRKEIKSYLEDFKNINVSTDQIIIAGGTEGIFQILTSLLGREKLFAVENPGYKKITSLLEMNGVKSIPLDIDQEGLRIDLLEKSKAQIVHLTPTHHFPTGKVMSVKRRMNILNWARKSKKNFIIEDDYDSEFRFNSKPITSLYSMDKSLSPKESKVIYINTFSKTLSPSLRISYMILPEELLKIFEKKFTSYSCQVSVFEQMALANFIGQGFYSKHIIKMKNYYKTIRNEIISCINKSPLSKITSIHEEEAGLHFLLEVKKENLEKSKILLKLKKEKIKIPLLSEYYYKKEKVEKNTLTFILNYSALEKENIKESIRRLEKALL